MTMTTNEMKNINLDQLDNVTGGTYPRRPDIKLGTHPAASTFVKSIFPAIGRHGIEIGNAQKEAVIDTIGIAKNESVIDAIGIGIEAFNDQL